MLVTSCKIGTPKEAVVPLRKEPCVSSERIDEVLFGMNFKILSENEAGWYYIRTFYDYEGYINADDVLLVESSKMGGLKKNSQFFISQSFADVMELPKYNSKILVSLTRGAFVCCTGEEESGWSKIQLQENSYGWVKSTSIKQLNKEPLENEEIMRKNIVETALSYLGTQYRWGGKTPFGIDCSGLCSIAYLLNGFIIYRDAELKSEYMNEITIEKMKPCDLLFFPGHVAMHLDKNKFIHSNSKDGGVAIGSFDPKDVNYREDLYKTITKIGSIFA